MPSLDYFYLSYGLKHGYGKEPAQRVKGWFRAQAVLGDKGKGRRQEGMDTLAAASEGPANDETSRLTQ